MITSTGSSQVKHVVQLQKKAKSRKEEGLYIVEGIKMVSEAPKEMTDKVYVSETFSVENRQLLQKLPAGREQIEIVSDNVFQRMSDTQTPQGILAIVRMKQYKLADMLEGCPLLLCLENLQDPGNLGTILRMGEGAGVTGIVMSRNTVDIYNPKTIRSTMGSIYRVPFLYADNFGDTLNELRQAGVSVYAAHPYGGADYAEQSYTQPAALLIGNEANGLTQEALEAADMRICIHMEGKVESLNAAVAAAVLSFEVLRQRKMIKKI